MALGITRAADRVAVWHEAGWENEVYEGADPPDPKPTTSTPPAGAPAPSTGQGVVIPNSNKFKTPANGLKKLLETTTHPDQGFHPESTKAVEDWLGKKPDFTKTYFKPNYADALKAHLGEDNYAKLLHHAPTPYSDALTIHQQAPAPKSNKFLTPANSLKKLLETKGTSTEHLMNWMVKTPTNGQFSEKYLKNPAYQDALKAHLGPKNYGELKKHLDTIAKGDAPSKAEEIGQSLSEKTPFKPMTTEEFFGPGGPAAPDLGPKPKKSLAELFGTDDYGKPKGNIPTMLKHPEFTAEHAQEWLNGPGEYWKNEYLKPNAAKQWITKPWASKWIKMLTDDQLAQAGLLPKDQADIDAIKNEQAKSAPSSTPPGGIDPDKVSHPALQQAVQQIFPKGKGPQGQSFSEMTDKELKKQLEDWHHYLAPERFKHTEYPPAFAAAHPKIKEVYNKFFGDKGAPSTYQGPTDPDADIPLPASDKYQDLLDKINEIKPGWLKTKGWLQGQDEQGKLKNSLKMWTVHPGLTPEEKAGFQALHDELYGGGKAPAPDVNFEPPKFPTKVPISKTIKWNNDLLSSAEAHAGISGEDMKALKSNEFKHWFAKLPATTQSTAHYNPKLVLQKYQEATGQDDKDEISQIQEQMGGDPWGSDAPGANVKQMGFTTPSAEELTSGAGLSSMLADSIAEQTPEKFQKNLQWAKDHPGESGTWDKILQWHESKQPEEADPWEQQLLESESKVPRGKPSLDIDQATFSGEVPVSFLEGGKGAEPPYKWAPGAQAWLAEQGITDPSHVKYTKLTNLYKGWQNLSEDDKQKYIAQEQGGQAAQPAFDAKAFAKEMGKTFGIDPEAIKNSDLLYKDMTPEQAKAEVASLLSNEGMWNDTEKAAIKKWEGILNGQGEAQPAAGGADINKPQLLTDLANVWNISPEASFIQEVSQAFDENPEQAKALIEDKLQSWSGESGSFAESVVDKLKGVLNAHFGQGSEQATAPTYDPEAALDDYAAIYPGSYKGDLSAASTGAYKDPEQFKALLLDKIKYFGTDTKKGQKFQQVYDKWFGQTSSGAPGGGAPFDPMVKPADPATLKSLVDHLWPSSSEGGKQAYVESLQQMDPKGWADWANAISQSGKKDKWQAWVAQMSGGTSGAKAIDESTNPLTGMSVDEVVKATGLLPISAQTFLEQGPKAFWENYHYVKNHNLENEPWQKVIKWVDSHGGSQQSSGAAPFDSDTINAEYAQVYNKSLWDLSASWTAAVKKGPEAVKKLLQDKIETNKNNGGNKWQGLQKIYDKYFGSGPQQTGPAPFVWKDFGKEFKALFPGSAWATEDNHTPQEAEAKLKGAVETAKANFPDTEKTKAAEALYQKYFGNGIPAAAGPTPSGGDLNDEQLNQLANLSTWSIGTATWKAKSPEQQKQSLQQLIQEHKDSGYDGEANLLQALYNKWYGASPTPTATPVEPEEEQGVSVPFKTDDPNPQELSMWAADKPDSPAEWKSFAQWWGKTKLTPEQEQQIYAAWFPNKAGATPEKANLWFQKVFEFHSKPGKGDLGQPAVPGWAHNSWAFGKNAEAEWPAFSAWASQHPGLGKNLTVKQKLSIWKGLSAGDKKAIAEDYLPANPIDTKAVVAALQKAYPDSDFSEWAKMGQGTLGANLETLAKAGYKGAIPLYNQFFGGKVPMPAEKEEKAEAKPAGPVLKPIPLSKVPEWYQSYYGANSNSEKSYASLKHFADSLGMGYAAEGKDETGQPNTGYNSPKTKLVQMWNSIPTYLKPQVDAMKTFPWKDEQGLQNWINAQPTLKDALMKIKPEAINEKSLMWNQDMKPMSYWSNKSALMGQLISNEPDMAKKQALLNVYHQFFGNGKETLAQALGAAYPGEDWDKFLKANPLDKVQAALKKRMKAEKDPEKFVQLVDIWGKYFSKTPGDTYNVANSGIGAVTNQLKSHTPGSPVSADVLKALHYWKAHGGTGTTVPSYWQLQNYEDSKYVKDKAKAGDTNGYPIYYGWTPPGEAVSGTFRADPAMMASPMPSYTAPPLSTGGKHYQSLLEKMNSNSAAYGPKDKEEAQSEEFQQWFASAPTPYKEVFQHNPGIALDDFKQFMSGELGSEVPDPANANKVYDVSPFAMIPKAKSKQDLTKVLYPGFKGTDYLYTHDWSPLHYNPQRADDIKFPRAKDPQETLPGVQWAPKYQPMPIYRVMRINPYAETGDPKRDEILKKIRTILEGTGPGKPNDTPNLFTDEPGQSWPKDAPPIPKSPDQWMDVLNWAKKNNISMEQMYDLAEKAGATPGKYGQPPLAKTPGTFDHPDLAHLLLDYLESPHKPNGGLGIHWTRSRKKAYEGIPSAGEGATTHNPSMKSIPIMVSGLWGGQGESPENIGGAYDPHASSELEHTLLPHAPVLVRRLQIKDPNSDWHDLIDYGPMSMWPEGRDEQTKDKPSLSAELNEQLGAGLKAKDWDDLKPGPTADKMFYELAQKYPGQKDVLDKIYRRYFVGRPDLTAKPHHRYASLQRRSERQLEAAIEVMASLHEAGQAWDDDDDPYAYDDEETWDEDDEGTPVEDYATPVEGHSTPMFPEGQRPQLPGGDYKFYYSPHEINPPSASNARPNVSWGLQDFEQPPLTTGEEWDDVLGDTGDHFPQDRAPMPMYRGMMLDLTDPGLAHVRRALLGGEYEDPQPHGALEGMPGDMDLAQPNAAGYSNKSLGEHILNHVQENNRLYGGEGGGKYGLGPHWSTDPSKAGTFAGIAGVPTQLPVRLKAEWKGQGEDPYRTNTQGSWPDEKEITMLPGNNMNVTSVQIRHPKTHKWHEVLDKPTQRAATTNFIDQLNANGDWGLSKGWSGQGSPLEHSNNPPIREPHPGERNDDMWMLDDAGNELYRNPDLYSDPDYRDWVKNSRDPHPGSYPADISHHFARKPKGILTVSERYL